MNKKTANTTKTWEVQFVRCELDKDTKEQVKKFDPKFEWTWDAFDRLITDGYKISIAHDKYHDCVGVFATMPDNAHPNHGQCLTARGPDYRAALKVLCFKHFNLLDANWGSENGQEVSRDDWG